METLGRTCPEESCEQRGGACSCQNIVSDDFRLARTTLISLLLVLVASFILSSGVHGMSRGRLIFMECHCILSSLEGVFCNVVKDDDLTLVEGHKHLP